MYFDHSGQVACAVLAIANFIIVTANMWAVRKRIAKRHATKRKKTEAQQAATASTMQPRRIAAVNQCIASGLLACYISGRSIPKQLYISVSLALANTLLMIASIMPTSSRMIISSNIGFMIVGAVLGLLPLLLSLHLVAILWSDIAQQSGVSRVTSRKCPKSLPLGLLATIIGSSICIAGVSQEESHMIAAGCATLALYVVWLGCWIALSGTRIAAVAGNYAIHFAKLRDVGLPQGAIDRRKDADSSKHLADLLQCSIEIGSVTGSMEPETARSQQSRVAARRKYLSMEYARYFSTSSTLEQSSQQQQQQQQIIHARATSPSDAFIRQHLRGWRPDKFTPSPPQSETLAQLTEASAAERSVTSPHTTHNSTIVNIHHDSTNKDVNNGGKEKRWSVKYRPSPLSVPEEALPTTSTAETQQQQQQQLRTLRQQRTLSRLIEKLAGHRRKTAIIAFSIWFCAIVFAGLASVSAGLYGALSDSRFWWAFATRLSFILLSAALTASVLPKMRILGRGGRGRGKVAPAGMP